MSNFTVLDRPPVDGEVSLHPASILVYHMGRTVVVGTNRITFLEGDGNYTYVYTHTGAKYLICKTLKSLALKLDSRFIRVHKSFLCQRPITWWAAPMMVGLPQAVAENEGRRKPPENQEIIGLFGTRSATDQHVCWLEAGRPALWITSKAAGFLRLMQQRSFPDHANDRSRNFRMAGSIDVAVDRIVVPARQQVVDREEKTNENHHFCSPPLQMLP